MLEPYNLLVLDEPTNHMDMRSKDILKSALLKYDGTVIVVSHDREFLDGLVDKVYEFRDGQVREHLGGIYDFLEKKRMDSLRELERKKAAEKPAESAIKSDAGLSSKEQYQEKQKRDRLLKATRSAIGEIEGEIERLEAEIAAWDTKLSDPSAHGIDLSDPTLFEQYNGLKARLAKAMKRWEELNFELEILETT
jgi:ATP-binding cassette subfamily F protein 3